VVIRLRAGRRLKRLGWIVVSVGWGVSLFRTLALFVVATPGHGWASYGWVAGALISIAPALLLAILILALDTRTVWVVGALANALFILILNFGTLYLLSGTVQNWGIRLTHTDALLITLGNLTTAGTAGITPHSEFARLLITTQLAVDIPVTILLFGLLVARVGSFAVEWLSDERRMLDLVEAQSSALSVEPTDTGIDTG